MALRVTQIFRSGTQVLVTLVALVGMAACTSRSPAPVVDRPMAQKPGAITAKPAPRSERPEFYSVRPGESLRSIASVQGMDARDILELNKAVDPNRLQTGQVLRLRPATPVAAGVPNVPSVPSGPSSAAASVPPSIPDSSVQVSPITLPGNVESRPLESRPLESRPQEIARPASPPASSPSAGSTAPIRTEPRALKLPYSDDALVSLQRGEAPVLARADPRPGAEPPKSPVDSIAKPDASKPPAGADQIDWLWPANGHVVERFDDKSNRGVDISGKTGEPVFAAAAGRVMYVGANVRGYGQLVVIKHNDTYISAYAHNSKLLVKEGQTVKRGDKIAELGQSDADRPKLHFEIRRGGRPVDPLAYLPERP